MQIFIDADGCPVVDITARAAAQYHLECILVCDTSHVFNKKGLKTITVSKGADSVDFALVNMIQQGDIVVTQDYGLAAMCLARKAYPIHQDGILYNESNIDGMLLARHTAKKIRNAGGRIKGPSKRMPIQDEQYEKALIQLINERGDGK